MRILYNVVGCVGLFSMFSTIAGLIIFRLYLIPKIEKRLGGKLVCNTTMYKYSMCTNMYGKASEFCYIAYKYLYAKFRKKNEPIKNKFFKRLFAGYALDQRGYKIEEATKFEIFISLVLMFCPILCFICGGLLYFKIVSPY